VVEGRLRRNGGREPSLRKGNSDKPRRAQRNDKKKSFDLKDQGGARKVEEKEATCRPDQGSSALMIAIAIKGGLLLTVARIATNNDSGGTTKKVNAPNRGRRGAIGKSFKSAQLSRRSLFPPPDQTIAKRGALKREVKGEPERRKENLVRGRREITQPKKCPDDFGKGSHNAF